MNIAVKNNLTKSEISEILLLNDICNLVDRTHSKPKLSTDLNISKSIPTFFLGREDDILVSLQYLCQRAVFPRLLLSCTPHTAAREDSAKFST